MTRKPAPPPVPSWPAAPHVRASVLRPLQAKLPGPAAPARQPAPHLQAALSAVQAKTAGSPAPVSRPPMQAPTPLCAVQAKIPPGAWRPSSPSPSTVLQRSATVAMADDYAVGVLEDAKDAGARLGARAAVWVDIDAVKREYFGWFSKGIQSRMGIPDRPDAGSACPNCGRATQAFELDHMTPWRQYVAVLISRDFVRVAGGRTEVRADVAKALYNDPENLWWICRDCNNPKSDILPVDAKHAAGDFSAGITGRASTYRSGAIAVAASGR